MVLKRLLKLAENLLHPLTMHHFGLALFLFFHLLLVRTKSRLSKRPKFKAPKPAKAANQPKSPQPPFLPSYFPESSGSFITE